MRAAACPARGAIPAMDVRRVRHRGQSTFSKPREHGVSKPNAFGLPHTERHAMGSEQQACGIRLDTGGNSLMHP
jgi:hypothetical protein